MSCPSAYFSYQDSKAELTEGLDGDLWQLKKEDITDCNALQERLLNSSWNLLRQYKLPDSYRLVQRGLDDLYKAVNERDPNRRLRMLRALEREFRVYPPYWYYRARAAWELKDEEETRSCWDKFDEVWRPVLRQDPYKVEAVKFRIAELMKGGRLSDAAKSEVRGLLGVMEANTPRDDWADNLFAGVAYFLLGEKNRAVEIVESNVDFGYGAEVSGVVLRQLKAGKLEPESLSSELGGLVRSAETPAPDTNRFAGKVKDKELAEALIMYFEGRESEAETALESMSATSKNPVVFWALYQMNSLKNYPKAQEFLKKYDVPQGENRTAFDEAYADIKPLIEFYAERQVPFAQTFLGVMYYTGWGVEKDDAEAARWYRRAAEQGYAEAQNKLGFLYDKGEGVKEDKAEAVEWYRKAAEQGLAMAQVNLGFMYSLGEGVKKDYTEGVRWYRKAAEQGLAMAQVNLGFMYENGYGVQQDYKTAYMWYYLTSLFVDGLADEKLRELEKEGWFSSAKVSPSEAREAKVEARRKYDEIRKRYGLI